MVQKVSNMVQKMVQNGSWDPLGLHGDTQRLHMHIPRSIFIEFWSILGYLGEHIFSHFGMLFSIFFWSSLLKQFWTNMVTVLAPFWKLFWSISGNPWKSENLTPACTGALFSGVQGIQKCNFFRYFLTTGFECHFCYTFCRFWLHFGILWGSFWHLIFKWIFTRFSGTFFF